MILFAYYKHDFVVLNKYILEVIKLNTYLIYILEIKQKWSICKEYIERDII